MSAPNPVFFARLVDANANRAREGLRVAEDAARFLLSSSSVTTALKELRHEVTAAVASLPLDSRELLAARDSAADVASPENRVTDPTPPARSDLASFLSSNLHRAQESLRVLEETARLLQSTAAQRFERARYTAYELEKELLQAIVDFPATTQDSSIPLARQARVRRFLAARLYVITDTTLSRGRSDEEITRAALAGGADVIQLRAKQGSRREILARARVLKTLCTAANALFIVNDRPGIAVLSDADGMHVGQDDLAVGDVRKVIGQERLVGVSTHALHQAHAAAAEGADYIGVGPVYETATKGDVSAPVGVSYVREVSEHISVPFVAIGGIKEHNAALVAAAGADRIAVITAAVSADDVEDACHRLRAEIVRARSAPQLAKR